MPTTDLPPPTARRGSLAWAARAARVRLRFVAALAVASLVVGRWEALRTHWDRWTAPAARDPAMGAVSADTEYFCPMDPGVVSGWPGQCPVCQMATVRRSRRDMGPLPSGVVARVQFSPDRVQLAGIRSEPVGYRPLAREVRSLGAVEVQGGRVSIRSEISAEEAAWLEPGMRAEVVADPPDGTAPARGRVVAVASPTEARPMVVVEVEGPSPSVRRARLAWVAIRPPMAGREPFRSMPRGEPPVRLGEPRSVHACPDHPATLQAGPGRCPEDGRPLERSDLARNQRLAWWCPEHPEAVADRPGGVRDDCNGLPLAARVVAYSPAGLVLAVPESSVIDTGTRTVVYVERMPGVFDGVEVRLGPRCGGYYPVVDGLEAGQVVASAGAFLVDAETRLNPSLAAGYFGAQKPGDGRSGPWLKAEATGLDALSPADRAAASAQGTCPVTGKRLGSMGTPVRSEAGGRAVFLCREGCAGSIREAPARDLARPKAAFDPVPRP